MALPFTFTAATLIGSAQVNANFVYLDTQAAGKLVAANNLSDLANVVTARGNLGLGSAALATTGAAGHTVPFLDGANTWSNTNNFTTQAPGDNSTKAATTAFVQAAVAASSAILRGYISGLILSAPGGVGTFGIAAGVAADSTSTSMMALATAYTKTTAAWAVGTAAGALDTGAVANGWYHVYEIKRLDTGIVDIAISTSAAGPTFGSNIPVAYTLFRRIGAILNAGGTWTAFTQIGNDFFWMAAVSGNTGTLASAATSLVTLTGVPTGVKVKVRASVSQAVGSGGTSYIAVSPPDTGGQAASINNAVCACNGSSAIAAGQADVWSNTVAQIYVAVTGTVSTTYSIGILGWADQRGQNS